MKAKRQKSVRRVSDGLASELRQKRLDDYLKNTRASFAKNVEYSRGQALKDVGVLAGPVKLT